MGKRECTFECRAQPARSSVAHHFEILTGFRSSLPADLFLTQIHPTTKHFNQPPPPPPEDRKDQLAGCFSAGESPSFTCMDGPDNSGPQLRKRGGVARDASAIAVNKRSKLSHGTSSQNDAFCGDAAGQASNVGNASGRGLPSPRGERQDREAMQPDDVCTSQFASSEDQEADTAGTSYAWGNAPLPSAGQPTLAVPGAEQEAASAADCGEAALAGAAGGSVNDGVLEIDWNVSSLLPRGLPA